MRKFLIGLFCTIFLMPSVRAWDEYKFHYGYNMECAIDTNSDSRKAWFCGGGNQGLSCHGKKAEGNYSYWGYVGCKTNNTEPERKNEWDACAFYHHDRKFVCCGGTTSAEGKFVIYTNWSTEKYNEVGGGRCYYTVDPCGNTITGDKECSDPTWCPDGLVLRDTKVYTGGQSTTVKKCMTPCLSGQAYDGEYSDTCVECESTVSQGIDTNGVCIKCNKSNEFFKSGGTCTGEGCCKKKTETPSVPKDALKACWRCPANKDLWGRCIEGRLAGDDFKKCGFQSGTQIPPEYRLNTGTN